MQVDYIIVGMGLAGICLVEHLEQEQKRVFIFDTPNQNAASKIAIGLVNPMVLRFFTPVWQAQTQIDYLLDFYTHLSKKYKKKFLIETPLYRVLSDLKEQKTWKNKANQPNLSPFMQKELFYDLNKSIKATYGYAKVLQTYRLEIKDLIQSACEYYEGRGLLKSESFDYKAIEQSDFGVTYKGIKAKKIIFCEGYGLKKNPFFNTLPLKGNKGELLHLTFSNLEFSKIALKSRFFITSDSDLGLQIGATYDSVDKSSTVSPKAKTQLLNEFTKLWQGPKPLHIEQKTAIRPTVIDRRPLVGIHPKMPNFAILNGMGTRGTMLAPIAAKWLLDFLCTKVPLAKEVDVCRFF